MNSERFKVLRHSSLLDTHHGIVMSTCSPLLSPEEIEPPGRNGSDVKMNTKVRAKIKAVKNFITSLPFEVTCIFPPFKVFVFTLQPNDKKIKIKKGGPSKLEPRKT
jgi:hypothetical protein